MSVKFFSSALLVAGLSASGPLRADNHYVAETDPPAGRFTTAAEVRPILGATRANWVALRVFQGQDLVYVTQVFAWRCGLAGLRFGINGGALQDWPLPECHKDGVTPNALLDGDGPPYRAFLEGTVDTIHIELIYDDLGREAATFTRDAVLMP